MSWVPRPGSNHMSVRRFLYQNGRDSIEIHVRREETGFSVEWHVVKADFVAAPVRDGCIGKAGDGRD
jgi:hypothetical protein